MDLRALLPLGIIVVSLHAQEPDYTPWNRLLASHYDRLRGMDYQGLATRDWGTMKRLLRSLGEVDVARLNRKERLAYFLNLYNITVANLLMENRQVNSIRDLSTDPIIRINIFKKDLVKMRTGQISLKRLEDEFIREGFQDPRIHFAINCGARSCPPMGMEAFTGARLEAQLNDQARAFFAHPVLGARLEPKGSILVVHLTKIMDGGSWFARDFEQWGGGRVAFLRKYLPPSQQQVLDEHQGRTTLKFDDYNWGVNRWER